MDGLFSPDMLALHPAPPRRRTQRQVRPLPGTCAGQPWTLDGTINVVLFAGMGGACQGLEDAGFHVHVAVNHDAVAIAAHKELNPHTKHLQADIYEVCPLAATGGRAVNILWASPDCRDHSAAKGGAPRSPRVRSMPWQVCRWVGVLRKRGLGPEVVFLENVREIRGWGPLIAKRDPKTGRVVKLDGTVAAKGERVPVQEQQLVRDPRHLGRSYRAWVRHVQALGAVYQDRDLNAADYGAHTSRKRLFGIGHFDGRQPVWPERTHASRKELAKLNASRTTQGLPALLPHRAAAEIIDWSLPLPSIFDRKRPLAPATLKRVAVGTKRYVLQSASPFLVHLTHHGQRPEVDPAGPLPTITGAHRGEMALISPYLAGTNNVSTRASRVFPVQQAPVPTQCTAQGMALAGAALVPTTHSMSPPRVHDSQDPAPTFTAAVKGGELGLIAATVVGAGGRAGQSPPMDVADPLNTSTTKEDRLVVSVFLEEHRSRSVGQPVTEPLPTQTQRDHHAVIGAALVQTAHSKTTGRAPGASPVDGPTHTVTQSGGQAVMGAYMVQHNTGVVGHDAGEPLSTMTTVGTQQQLAAAHLIQLQGTADAKDAANPVPSQTAQGLHTGICAAHLTEYYGTGGQHQDPAEALNTLTTKARFAVTGADLDPPPLVGAQLARARQVAEFLRAHGCWDGGEVVTLTIQGQCWAVVDIGMRMLTPAEAARAHGLRMPASIVIDGKRRPLTKSEGMRLVGNSVVRSQAQLLASLNAFHTLAVPAVAAE